ncbi:MAG: response regulator [Thermoanaerobaculia bacterium]|nr:response regulator [Thermoanaerobaculia bacterium]
MARDGEANSHEILEQERAIFIAGPVAIFKWRNLEAWPVEYASPNVGEILGYSAESFLAGDVSYAEIIHPEDLERVVSEVGSHSASGAERFEHVPYRIVRRDGRVIWIADYTNILRNEDGEVTHYQGYIIDITDRVEAEQERRRIEERARQAQKLESLGILAGGIAHDFNNLLVGIVSNADYLLTLVADEQISPRLQDIRQAGLRAAELCREMLAYSGKGRFHIEQLDLNHAVEEMTHLLESAITKKARLRFELGQTVPLVSADGSQIRQVIMNLITNASEALEDVDGDITIRTGFTDLRSPTGDAGSVKETGRFVFFEVEDTGVGMSKELQERMFEPFFSTKFTGRGLGLSAVQGIAKGHGGSIEVDSQAGVGTRMRILLPAAPRPKANVGDRRRSGDSSGEHLALGETVLVVDDESTVRKVVRTVLESAGQVTLEAQNGREAVEVFRPRAAEIGYVFLDMTMPEMDGAETLAALRQIRPNIPVVLASGYDEKEVLSDLGPLDRVAFLQKPFLVEDLLEAVDTLVTKVESLTSG